MTYEVYDTDIIVRLTLDEGLNEYELFVDKFEGYETQWVADTLIYILDVNDSNVYQITDLLDSIDEYISDCYDELEEVEEDFC